MQKSTRKIVHKKKTASLPKNKKVIKRPKEDQDKAPEILKSSDKKVEKATLLNANQIRASLENLLGWQSNNDNKMIYREYILRDFMAAIDLIDRIAKIAEDEKHHPDIHLTQYRNLRVGTTTHEVGGLSKSDFNVASRINDLPMELSHK
ncbi:MAG: 4a-hydroxytetrahydrobiopterin dehydratase [Candidatus Omnitrophota bacterium]|nr:4a-hydroxytetrahydrobiopterin dehydratase [Candidatus Omnitrophota bacterium]